MVVWHAFALSVLEQEKSGVALCQRLQAAVAALITRVPAMCVRSTWVCACPAASGKGALRRGLCNDMHPRKPPGSAHCALQGAKHAAAMQGGVRQLAPPASASWRSWHNPLPAGTADAAAMQAGVRQLARRAVLLGTHPLGASKVLASAICCERHGVAFRVASSAAGGRQRRIIGKRRLRCQLTACICSILAAVAGADVAAP